MYIHVWKSNMKTMTFDSTSNEFSGCHRTVRIVRLSNCKSVERSDYINRWFLICHTLLILHFTFYLLYTTAHWRSNSFIGLLFQSDTLAWYWENIESKWNYAFWIIVLEIEVHDYQSVLGQNLKKKDNRNLRNIFRLA